MGNGSPGEQLAANIMPVREYNSDWRGAVCEARNTWLTEDHCTQPSTAEQRAAPKLFGRGSREQRADQLDTNA
ncbi:hypothetical protein NDU88_004269 [Pleurodeles waltl]|uniref:Uncharacterized protein n=1 Tax=Pleurodeles waltl TaxID=8319 RepID=A0AAV7MU30_PLEWA|nr:hypothetical protein NDU88_004269 [Pleurodeles waltl]